MRLDVYHTDAEAFAAAAAHAAACLRELASPRPSVALPGGRAGRGVMLALAGRDDLPWERVHWYWAHERIGPPDDPLGNVRIARDSLLDPRRVPLEHAHAPRVELGDAGQVAAAYAETLATDLGRTPPPVFDLLLLGIGPEGDVAGLRPGAPALDATAAVAPVTAEAGLDGATGITITPPVIRAARRVVVTMTGDASAAAMAAALREPDDVHRVPAQLVRPAEHVAWFVDRAAATILMKDAEPATAD